MTQKTVKYLTEDTVKKIAKPYLGVLDLKFLKTSPEFLHSDYLEVYIKNTDYKHKEKNKSKNTEKNTDNNHENYKGIRVDINLSCTEENLKRNFAELAKPLCEQDQILLEYHCVSSANDDFYEAKNCLSIINTVNDLTAQIYLLMYSVASYARPFLNCEMPLHNIANGNVQVKRKLIDVAKVQLAADEEKLHEEIIHNRDKYVAHSDLSVKQQPHFRWCTSSGSLKNMGLPSPSDDSIFEKFQKGHFDVNGFQSLTEKLYKFSEKEKNELEKRFGALPNKTPSLLFFCD